MEGKAKAGAYDRLVIAAAPMALGNLRKAMSDHVRKTVVAELETSRKESGPVRVTVRSAS